MDSNTHSTDQPDRLGPLEAAKQALATEDLGRLTASALSEDTVRLRRLLDGLEGEWLRRLATLDACGAAGADQDQPALSTASWLRNRQRMGTGVARGTVRTARALFRGPLKETAAALTAGDISLAHAREIAEGTRGLPEHVQLDADLVLAELAGRLDPPDLRRAAEHLRQVADPEGADRQAQRHHERRGLWLAPTWEGMVAVKGLLEPEAGHIVRAALEALARPAAAGDDRSGDQRTADALAELARRSLEGGWLPTAGGVRPQLLVTMDLETLLGDRGSLGGDTGWVGPLAPETCRRLACDGAVTRIVVNRQPTGSGQADPGGDHDPGGDPGVAVDGRASPQDRPGTRRPTGEPAGLQARLRTALAGLPPTLGGAPSQPLDVGRATRVVPPAQRTALAVRDRGCVFPGCDRPLAWCDAHHLWHWVDGGPTDLANLALLCRAHHRTVHEGGWQLTRGPDGRFTATAPPTRRHRGAG